MILPLILIVMLRITGSLVVVPLSRPERFISTWRDDWNRIKKMRSESQAPVDTMGAEALADKANSDFGTPAFRFRTLVATMLSPQTKDKQTSIALNNLIAAINPSPFIPSNFKRLEANEIQECISGVSFAKTKSENILKAAEICASEYCDDIPPTIDKLLLFRGVGPKIAYLTFSIAFNQHLGIVVDTHVHRIANRLGWADSKTPEQTRKQLESCIPQEHWEEVNNLLVGFGQTICSAKVPKCSACLLNTTCKFRLEAVKSKNAVSSK